MQVHQLRIMAGSRKHLSRKAAERTTDYNNVRKIGATSSSSEAALVPEEETLPKVTEVLKPREKTKRVGKKKKQDKRPISTPGDRSQKKAKKSKKPTSDDENSTGHPSMILPPRKRSKPNPKIASNAG